MIQKIMLVSDYDSHKVRRKDLENMITNYTEIYEKSNKKYLPSLSSLINLLILCSSGSNGALFCWTFIRYFSEQNTLLKVIRISTSDSMNF